MRLMCLYPIARFNICVPVADEVELFINCSQNTSELI